MTEHSARQLKILYIEDELLNMDLMRAVLKLRPSIRLLEARSGGAAMIIADAEHPDLILLDRNLPDMGGEDVLRMLRGRTATIRTPVIVISGDTARPNSTETQLGVAGYIIKPYDIAELLSLIDETLAHSGP